MKAHIEGQFLSAETKVYDGKKTGYVKLLSEDDSIRIKFESDMLDKFESCQKLNRMDNVLIVCSITVYNGELYYKALRE